MKRTSGLVVPLSLLAVLAVAIGVEIPEQAGPPARVQVRLDEYLASPFAPGQSTVLLVERARRPWNFAGDLSGMALGDSVYFQTDSSLTWTEGSGPSPLPFPPKELWCAFLEGTDDITGEKSHIVVFVGLHMDMYTADWLVHKAAESPFAPEFGKMLAHLGCDVGWD